MFHLSLIFCIIQIMWGYVWLWPRALKKDISFRALVMKSPSGFSNIFLLIHGLAEKATYFSWYSKKMIEFLLAWVSESLCRAKLFNDPWKLIMQHEQGVNICCLLFVLFCFYTTAKLGLFDTVAFSDSTRGDLSVLVIAQCFPLFFLRHQLRNCSIISEVIPSKW